MALDPSQVQLGGGRHVVHDLRHPGASRRTIVDDKAWLRPESAGDYAGRKLKAQQIRIARKTQVQDAHPCSLAQIAELMPGRDPHGLQRL